MDKDLEINGEILADFIAQHTVRTARYRELKDQYLSNPPILKKDEIEEEWKPDNRRVANFGKYIIDTFNGFFNGVPLKVNHENKVSNDFIQEFWRANDMSNVLNELAKTTSIYGRGYLYLYQNENAETEVAYNDPLDMFVIYTDDIRPRSKYAVRYRVTEEGIEGQIFDGQYSYRFLLDEETLVMEVDEQLYYGRVPIIEFIENEERQSLIEPVETLINGFNSAFSDKNNDIDYFADAYLAILGADIKKENIKDIGKNRVMVFPGSNEKAPEVRFLEKPDADTMQENYLDRTERLIYQLSQVANVDDTTFKSSGNSSGIALEYKLQPMKNLASNKERKFQQGLQTMFAMLFNLVTNVPATQADDYIDISYNWSRNLPANNADEAKTVRDLTGIISHQKQLEMLSAVDDETEELERIEEENKPRPYFDHEKGDEVDEEGQEE